MVLPSESEGGGEVRMEETVQRVDTEAELWRWGRVVRMAEGEVHW